MDPQHGPTAAITIPGLVLSTWSGTGAAQSHMFGSTPQGEDEESMRLAQQIADAPVKRAGARGTYKIVTMDKGTMAAFTDYLLAWLPGAEQSEEHSEAQAIRTTLGRLAKAKRSLA